MAKYAEICIIKAADRLANVRVCLQDNNQRLLEVYRSEQTAFKKAACRLGQCDNIWEEIEKLLCGRS